MNVPASRSVLRQVSGMGGLAELQPDLSQEFRLLIAATDAVFMRSAVAGTDSAAFDWNAVIALAARHRVTPFLRSLAGIAPREVLQPALHGCALRSLQMAQQTAKAATILRDANVRCAAFKGPALAQFVYGDASLRESVDIDLLISRESVAPAADALLAAGYRLLTPFTPRNLALLVRYGHELSFQSASGTLVELQWTMQQAPANDTVAFEALNLMPVLVASQQVFTPGVEALIVLLALHGAKHQWSRLIWLADLRALLARGIDWQCVAQLARTRYARRSVQLAIKVNRLVYGEPPHPAPASFAATRDVASLAEFCVRVLLGNSEAMPHHRLMLAMQGSWQGRARYIAGIALAPGPVEFARAAPRWAYPVLRLWRGIRVAATAVFSAFRRPARGSQQ